MSIKAIALAGAILLGLSGCGTPPFELFPDGKGIAPSGPKVVDLIDNLKCELTNAVNDARDPIMVHEGTKDERSFSLYEWLSAIHYVATVQFSLEVTDTPGISPSLSKIYPYRVSSTNLTLAVGGTFSDAGDRTLNLNTTVDLASFLYQETTTPCERGRELRGDLRLNEILAMGFINSIESDSPVVPSKSDSSVESAKGQPPDDATAVTSSTNVYLYGVFGTVTLFTVIENASGGPTWTLVHFKGPGGSQNLLSFNRQVKDTINISFIPYCKKDDAVKADAASSRPLFPPWASTLNPCGGEETHVRPSNIPQQQFRFPEKNDSRFRAIGAGSANNAIQTLQNALPQLQLQQ